jgi:acyl dehydratase
MTDDAYMQEAHVRFGDFVVGVGHRFSKAVHISKTSIREFAQMCGDHNPVHHDPEFATGTRFGGIIASGPHTLALFTAMVATHFSSITPMVGIEFSYKFVRAVRPGDDLTMTWEVTGLEPKASLAGVLTQLEGRVTNQTDEIVLSGTGTVLLCEKL